MESFETFKVAHSLKIQDVENSKDIVSKIFIEVFRFFSYNSRNTSPNRHRYSETSMPRNFQIYWPEKGSN